MKPSQLLESKLSLKSVLKVRRVVREIYYSILSRKAEKIEDCCLFCMSYFFKSKDFQLVSIQQKFVVQILREDGWKSYLYISGEDVMLKVWFDGDYWNA